MSLLSTTINELSINEKENQEVPTPPVGERGRKVCVCYCSPGAMTSPTKVHLIAVTIIYLFFVRDGGGSECVCICLHVALHPVSCCDCPNWNSWVEFILLWNICFTFSSEGGCAVWGGQRKVRDKERLVRQKKRRSWVAGATDTRHNHWCSAKTATGNQGCLGNLALSIKHGHLRAHIRVPVEMMLR